MQIFDSVANSYDSWYLTKMGGFVDKVETDLAFKLFKVEPGMHIIDIGCGTGNFSIKLAKMGCKVIGIDVSDEMLDIAREKTLKEGLEIEFHNMNVYDLKFKDDTFDGAFSMAAFEFITEPEKAISEIFRVVKKYGRILIGTINKDSKWGELYLTKDYQSNTVFKHADFKTLEDLKSIISEKVIATGECLFVPPNSKEEEFTVEKEAELSIVERGGYICVLWEK
jgi:ubiquinone/menaquinone biosynthesis C-methylase UbiE